MSSGRVWVPDVKPGTLSSPKPDGSTPSPLTSTSNEMTFFVTSAGSGNGADLGGLSGADALCERLARGGDKRHEERRNVFHMQQRSAKRTRASNYGTLSLTSKHHKGQNVWENEKNAQLVAGRRVAKKFPISIS